jgi:ABC-type branched-subunit amino acid transport system substrate-binding protein
VSTVAIQAVWCWTILALAGPGPSPAQEADSPPLRIGLLLPPEEAALDSLRQGAQLGLEHANQLAGPKVGLIARGRPGQWGDDGAEAARMVLDDGARGLIAPPGGAASHLSLQVAGRTAIPVVSLCADASVIGAGIPWMVRLSPSTTEEAQKVFSTVASWPPPAPAVSTPPGHAVRQTPQRRPISRWAAFVPAGRPGREVGFDLEKAARTTGCLLFRPIEITTNLPDAGPLARQALTNQPDGILLWLDPALAGRLAAALRASGFDGVLGGPGQLQTHDFVKAAGSAAEGLVVPGMVHDAASALVRARFVSDYQDRYHAEPDLSAALAYDAAQLLVHVLREAGPEAPHRAFPLGDVLSGASGNLRFDRDGRRQVTLNLLVCRNGKFVVSSPRW